jgi:hypothetical protein
MVMQIIEEHRSPDGSLRFIVCRDEDGDISLGFDGFTWHTHADILASLSGLPQDVALRNYVNALLSDRSIIATARVGGEIRDVWVSETAQPDKYKPDNETIEFRYWSGTPAI